MEEELQDEEKIKGMQKEGSKVHSTLDIEQFVINTNLGN